MCRPPNSMGKRGERIPTNGILLAGLFTSLHFFLRFVCSETFAAVRRIGTAAGGYILLVSPRMFRSFLEDLMETDWYNRAEAIQQRITQLRDSL